jgi:hypothetical protein
MKTLNKKNLKKILKKALKQISEMGDVVNDCDMNYSLHDISINLIRKYLCETEEEKSKLYAHCDDSEEIIENIKKILIEAGWTHLVDCDDYGHGRSYYYNPHKHAFKDIDEIEDWMLCDDSYTIFL